MSWKKVKLGKFLKVRDSRFKPNDVNISDLKRIEKIDFSGEIFISDKPTNTDMILIKKGDLVISGINVEKGAMAVYSGENDITATIHYSSYSFDEKEIDIEFLKFFLKSAEFKNALKEQVPGGIKTEIKPKHLLQLIVEIPIDTKDQKEIVEFLKLRNLRINSISKDLTHQLTLVKKLSQQLLHDALKGALVEQSPKDEPAIELLKRIRAEKELLIIGKKLKKEKEVASIKPEEIPFTIPENWVWCRFNEVVNIESNLVSPFAHPNKPHIAPDNIEKNTGKLLSYKTVAEDNVQSANHYFYSGQLIYSKVRPKLNKVVKVDFEGLCSADMYPLRSLVHTDFIQKCMLSEYFLKEVNKFDNRVKMPKINQNQLSQIPVPLPPLEEQKRIVRKLDQLMQYCNELEASVKESEIHNEKLLQQILKEALRKESFGEEIKQ